MAKWNIGPKNGFWKGGRTVTKEGYVLLRMPGHPLADCRGYVYEHRLIASAQAGRLLRTEEQVHHVDERTLNNSPENLEIHPNLASHRHRHAKRQDLRAPGELNPAIACACGCGISFALYDGSGRPRRYVSGHNARKALL